MLTSYDISMAKNFCEKVILKEFGYLKKVVLINKRLIEFEIFVRVKSSKSGQ